ncbi:TPR and ankyrin repeat-containing protein 1 [Bulinus truncatus]|nr:TPR and ankyrin repeat-containing protein 1 [Bulinus truncatus]
MLYEHDEYKALGILTVGTCGDSKVPETIVHKMAAVPKLDLSFVNIGKMLQFLFQKEEGTKKWHLQLAEFIVYRGATIRSIAEYFSKPVLVAVTELCINGEWPSFLSLVWDRITPAEYDDADSKGNTPLHIYVKSPKRSSDQALVVFHELMRKGCLTFLSDQAAKIPLQYVTKKDPCYYFLHDAEAVSKNARLERLKFLHDAGNKEWKENKWSEAITLYKYALIISQIYSHNSTTVLYSNLSAAYISTNNYKQALEAAENCLKTDPAFIKGYFRKGQALVKLGEKVKAFETYITGFKITTDTMFKISFVEESVKLINTTPGKDSATLIQRLKKILSESWSGFLASVTQGKKWDLLASLMLGPPYHDSNTVKQGIMGSCDAGTAAMSTFMPTFFESLGQLDTGKMSELLLKLLKQGASPADLSLPDETYFHTVVKFSINTRDIHVLRWILQKDENHTIVSAVDIEGRTPLHILCIEQEKRKENSLLYTNIAELLLAKGVHVDALDKCERQAAHYVSEGSELKIYLRTHENSVKKDFTSESDDIRNWKDIKAEGNIAYGQCNYELAKDLYSESIRCLEIEIKKKQLDLMLLNDEDGHNLAILYGNRAECWYKLNDKKNYLEDAKKNVDFDGSWFKGHQRVAKAFREKGKVETALKAYVNAYKTLKLSDGAKNRISVITDLVDCAFQLKLDPTKCFQDLKIASTTFALLTYELIKKKEWLKAEYTESLACNAGLTNEPLNTGEIDLACICDRDQLKTHYKWVSRLLLFFLRFNVELTKLKFHPGDTFFHAIVSISALNTTPPGKFREESHMILFHVVDTIIVPQKLQNVRDDKGNTVLHFIASLKGPEPMRQYLTHYLYEKGVNVMARNNDNALAIDLTKSNDVVRYILQSHMDKEAAITKAAERQKEEENKSKKQIKKETVPADKRQQKESIPIKSEVKPKAQSQTKNNQQLDEADKKKKEKSNVSASSKKLCDFCERKLDDALEYQKEEEYEKAYLQLVEVINTQKHQSDPRHKKLKQTSIQRVAALLSIVDTHEIPKSLIKNISSDGIKDVLYELGKTGKWIPMEKFVTQVKNSDRGKALVEFARSFSITNVIKESSLNGQTESKMRIIDLLLEYGARLERSESLSALTCSMITSDWKLVIKLLRLGANPKGVTLNPKDTPNHAALHVALSLDPGNFTILEELRNIYVKDKDKSESSYLSVSCQDADGNTLLHLACKVKFSSHSLRAVELLCEWQAPADLKNQEGKLPIEYLSSKNDRRAQYIKVAMGSESKVGGASHSARSRDKTSVKVSDQQISNVHKSTNQKFRDDAMKFLYDLPDAHVDFMKSMEEDNERYSDNEESDEEEDKIEDLDTYGDETKIEFEDDNLDDENIRTISKEDDSGFNIDVSSFDNLAWDVECTEDVWNILRSRKEKRAPSEQNTEDNPQKKSRKEKLSDSVKKIIVKYIYQLAKGQWRPHLQRRVKGIPDTLNLFKIQLPQGACLLWELAVAFSPRLSESAENLLAMEPSIDDDTALKRGRVYSELIRVWNVVLTQSEVEHFVRKIVRSHQRGKECIIQKKLKGINSFEIPNSSTSDRFPNLYIETINDKVSNEKDKHLELTYFPPASAHRNEFHILKFYSFSSTLVSSILSNTDSKVDFPFRVTDIEHAIISLDSNTPLLLLGRSGTGKTTCCLYRLWGMFLCYWEQAMKFNIPLIPREVPELLQLENGGDVATPEVKESKPDQASKESSPIDEGAMLDDDVEEGEEDENDEILYEHLHQMFVTKNPVLCTEVEKNFLKLRHASTILHMHNTAAKKILPNTLQEVDDVYFPLFLTSRQLLLMLDASIDGEPFFPRNEDLALKVEIPGWGTQEDIFNIAPLIHDFFMDSSDEDDDEDIPKKAKNPNSHSYRGQMKVNLRRECTYDVFASDIWPKIAKKVQLDCHASLAWMEIMSFIKGSYEALNTDNGYLDKAQYLDLGRKRAPNFTGDRAKIYEAFLFFNNFKQQHFLFDEADLVFKLYARLRTMTYIPWTLHEIYVDETQDFTQAELALLISLSLDPNKMFLTGDTAQSIMRGISFRFIDLKSLFYYAKESAKENENYLASIKVPQKVHQLRYNYRSHTGILSLASSVLDLLIEFFPESFDPLQKDQGMFAGPKPVVIESCSPADLALLLTGNRRKTSHIEFGAHQAILVVNDGAKERIPEELRTGIVLTIFESKGLEFDDVLIYNFFKDSQANKEWRVVTTFLENLVKRVNQEENSDNLVEIDTNVLCQYSRPRALAFDPNQHKLLNSELKHLYTALTRARVNVWIFDEDQEKRAPMFEYFKALKLVKCMEVGNSESITEELMFADSSTPQEWKQAGDNYMKQRLYQVAAKCYCKAFQPEKEKIALAHQVALEASRLKTSPKEMREKYLTAGVKFLECSDLYKAGICFQNSRDYLLAALTYEKNGQFEEAASQYKRLQDTQYTIDESNCLEKVGLFGRAVQVLVSAKLFDRAIDCLKRYKIQVKKLKEEGRSIPSVLIENKPSHSEENLCFSAAKYHHENKEHAKAKAAIARIKDLGMQIEFLKNHGYFSEAAQLMMDEGRTEEAATLVLRNGDADKALEYSRDSMNKQQSAFINLVLARKCEKENFNLDSIKKHAKKALENYIDLQDCGGQAHAKLILGKHTCDPKLLKDAYRGFEIEKPPNDVGRLESFSALMVMKSGEALSIDDCKWCLDSIKIAINLILNLTDTKGNRNEQKLSYLRFYGFHIDVSSQKVSWYPNEYPMCQDFMQPSIKEKTTIFQVTVDRIEALTAIEKCAIGWIKSWSQILKQHLSLLLEQSLPCRNFLEGLPCIVPDSKHKHSFIKTPQEEKDIFKILNTSVSLDFRLQTGLEELKEKASPNTTLIAELESLTSKDTCWDSVKNFLDFVFPASLPLTRDNPSFVKELVLKARISKDFVNQVQRYLTFLWNNPGRVGKGKSQNVVKERCKTSDWIVQACLFSELFRFRNFGCQEERTKIWRLS